MSEFFLDISAFDVALTIEGVSGFLVDLFCAGSSFRARRLPGRTGLARAAMVGAIVRLSLVLNY